MNIEKALVVDDSKVAHLTLRKLLSARGINVDWVGSGEESIDYLKKQKPDVVFMDVMMPGMDGFETVHAVKNDIEIYSPPIIMCSANTTDEDKQQASDNGAAGFLTKPYTPDELDDVLELVRTLPVMSEAPVFTNEDDSGLDGLGLDGLGLEFDEQLDNSDWSSSPPAESTEKTVAPASNGLDLDLEFNVDDTPTIAPLDTSSLDALDTPSLDALDTPSLDALDTPSLDALDTPSLDDTPSFDTTSLAATEPQTQPPPPPPSSPTSSQPAPAPDVAVASTAPAIDTAQLEQTTRSIAEDVARQVATETSQAAAEQKAREVAESYQQKATMIAAEAAHKIAKRIAQDVAQNSAQKIAQKIADDTTLKLMEQMPSTDNTANVESLRNELQADLQQQLADQVSQSLSSEQFKQQIILVVQETALPEVATLARDAANQTTWEVLAAKEEEENAQGKNSNVAGRIANVALFCSIVSLVLVAALFVDKFILSLM